MATVYNPVMPRRYNPNPRGSATTQVTMPGHNPFEQRTRLVNRAGITAQLAGFGPSGALPGMGMWGSHLGDDPASSDTGSADPATMAAAAQYAAAADAAGEATTTDPNAGTAYDVDASADQAQTNVANAGGSQAQQTAAYYAALTANASSSDQAVAAGQAAASNPQMVAAAQASLGPASGAAAKPAAAGVNWNQIFSTAVTGAGTTGAALISARYGKKPATASTPLAKIASSSMTPWIIGGVAMVGLVLVMTMHKAK